MIKRYTPRALSWLVVDLPSAYNAILGRPKLNRIWAVLMQDSRPIPFWSKALGVKNRALSTYEKELLVRAGVWWEKYRPHKWLLSGPHHQLFVQITLGLAGMQLPPRRATPKKNFHLQLFNRQLWNETANENNSSTSNSKFFFLIHKLIHSVCRVFVSVF